MRSSDLKQFSAKNLYFKIIQTSAMASASTSSSKAKRGSDMLVKGVEWKAPNFKIVPAVAESLDPNGAQSQIPPKVFLSTTLELILNVLYKR